MICYAALVSVADQGGEGDGGQQPSPPPSNSYHNLGGYLSGTNKAYAS